jgi:DNA-binding GntR family transcriptional regulator
MLRFNVYNRLRDDILTQVYKKGEALTEAKITKDLGVSRTPVREAFVQLQIDGLVDAIPNKGIIVRGLNNNDIQDMYDIRAHIETIAVNRVCENITKENLEILEKVLQLEMTYIKTKDYLNFQKSDLDFHSVIIRSSDSKIIENLLSSIMQYTRLARTKSLASGSRIQESYDEHTAIYNAIKRNDKDQAQALMEMHIKKAKEKFMKTMFEKENMSHD